ncbi:hypothetical protein ACFE04_024401 [Oxalis oulophora]
MQPIQEDPPSKLINQFLHKQQASGDFSLDMLEPIVETITVFPPVSESSPQNRVSFAQSPSDQSDGDSVRKRQQTIKDQASPIRDGGEVLKCSANSSFSKQASFKKSSLLTTTKTNKSRLLDPPEVEKNEQRTPRERDATTPHRKSTQMKSGFLMKSGNEEEEDDPLLEEDLPDEYKTEKVDIWFLLQWLCLILLVALLVCSVTIKPLITYEIWQLGLWKWDLMVLILICGRLVSGWMIRIVVFFIERNFMLRKRVLYFVYGLRKSVQNCLWLGLVLLAWHFLFDKKAERETKGKGLRNVTKTLVCLLIGTLIWLVKTLLIKVLESSFNVSTYFDRIQDSLFNQYVIETLSGPPLVVIRKTEEEEERIAIEVEKLKSAGATLPPGLSPRFIGSGGFQKSPREKSDKLSRANSKKEDEGGITIDHLHKLNPRNVSAWNMKKLINIIRHGALSTLNEQIQDSTHEDKKTTHIRSENEAKAAARKIFYNVAKPGSRFIFLEDLYRFMRDDEAEKTMGLFEGASESNRITKSALKNWVVNAFRERRALALTLNDTKTTVNKLHRFVNGLVIVIIIIIFLLVLEIATTKLLLFLSSQLILVAFVFGNTCKTVFESIIFLFVMHPFDVGDRCEIDGVQMIVEEMNILTTVFLRFDNQKIMYPNSVLLTKSIGNFYRSPDMGDAVEFCVHVATPADKIALMRQKIASYIENKKDHWYPAPTIVLRDVDQLNMIRIAVWMTHRMNHQNMGERFMRRSLLLDELIKIFRELDIQYRLYPIDINVRNMPLNSNQAPVTSTRLPPAIEYGVGFAKFAKLVAPAVSSPQTLEQLYYGPLRSY